MLKKLLKLLFIPALLLIVFTSFIAPETAAAQGVIGIPCEGAECNFCDFVTLANSVISWLIGVLAVIFGAMVFAAGFGLVTSGGNTSKLEEAKKSLTNALIGLIIVLASWLIVDTLLKATLPNGSTQIGPWNQVQCSDSQQPGRAYNTNSTLPGPWVNPSGVEGCRGGECLALNPAYCSNNNSCSLDPTLAFRAEEFHRQVVNLNGIKNVRITESMPPTVTHRNPCHQIGTCFDYNRQTGLSPTEIRKIIAAAKASSFYPEYEVKTQAEKDAILRAEPGISPNDIRVVTAITAPHFSIYMEPPR